MFNNMKLVCVTVLLLVQVPVLRAETVQLPSPEIENALLDKFEKEADLQRRKEAKIAEDTVKAGKELVSQGKFKEADALFKKALDAYNKIGGDYIALKTSQLNTYLVTFNQKWADAIMDEAYKAFTEKNYDLAIIKSHEAQAIEHLSKSRKDEIKKFVADCNAKIKSNEYKKITALDYKDVDPDNKARKYEMDVAEKNADTLIANGRYMEARDALEKILVRDPYNYEAAEKLKRMYKKLVTIGRMRRESDSYERMSEVVWRWSQPVLPVPAQRPDKAETVENKDASALSDKLSKLILKEVTFTDANIQAVVRFLAQESKRVDMIDGTGINIVLGIPEDEIDNVPLVTMSLENIPMSEVIRYLCQMCNLKYRIQEQVLTIGNDSIDAMDTKFFKVRSALITRIVPMAGGDSSSTADTGSEDDFFNPEGTFESGSTLGGDASSARDTTSEALKSYFRDRGIQFPEGSTIAYSKRSGKLTVKNTHENLRRLDTLLRALDVEQPQVLIETKFLEVKQTDLEEMGFEWWLTPTEGTGHGEGDNHKYKIGENDSLVRPLGVDKNGNTTSPVNTEVVGRVINDMVFPALNMGASVLGKYDVHMMLHALDQSKSTELLSAPKVIAKNGEEATIRMVREEYYPESWTEPELVIMNNSFQYTPPVPEFGDPEDIGIRLTVTPTVSPDNHTIALALNPQVIALVGWTAYNLNYAIGTTTTAAVVKMPEKSRRDIITNVKTYDGDTLVLGGMLKEDSRGSDDSFPGTTKVPLMGFLGRVQTDSHEKTNLMIFVTARIVNPDGLPIRTSKKNGLFDFRR